MGWEDIFGTVMNHKGKAITLVAGIAVVASSLFNVGTSEEGVVYRFGAYNRTTGPGVALKIPIVESVKKVDVLSTREESFGFRKMNPGVRSEDITVNNLREVPEHLLQRIVDEQAEMGYESSKGSLIQQVEDLFRGEYVCLTGDLNIVDDLWTVQWRVKDSQEYLHYVADPKKNLRDLSEVVMRYLAGDRSVDEVTTLDKDEIQRLSEGILQAKLDDMNAGIEIVGIKQKSVDPPRSVRAAVRGVEGAKQGMGQAINEAWAEYNSEIPRAEGEAEKLIRNAEGYKDARINNAQGDVARYLQVLTEYQRNPTITTERLWRETLKEILPKLDVRIVEQKGAEGGMLLHYDIGNKGGDE